MDNDETEVHRIATDPDAFAAFYVAHVAAVQRFVARRVADPCLAADLVADVFLAAVDGAAGYRPGRGSPGGWLTGVARNVVAAEFRRQGRQREAVRRISGRRLLDADSLARIEERGDVVVTISSLEDAEGLERALEAEGVAAEVEYDADLVPPAPPEGLDPDPARPAEPDAGTEERLETDGGSGDVPEGDLTPLPEDAGLEGQCLTSISTEVGRDGLTFRLPATAVDSDAALHITTSGSAEGWSGIAVRWEGSPC